MKREAVLFILLLVTLTIPAQTGKITSIKVLGIDKYPTESFLNISVTAKYASIKDEGSIIIYMDDDPQSTPSSTGGAWSMLLKRNHTGTMIPATKAEKTSTFTFKMKLHPERLKGSEVTKYYLRGFMSAKDYSERSDYLFTISEPVAFNINTVKVTNHKKDPVKKQPSAEERKRIEKMRQQSNQETMGILGGLLGAMVGVADDSPCMYCQGAGCASCNYTGQSTAAMKGFEDGYRMTNGGTQSSEKSSNKAKTTVLNGYHTKEYSDGTYKGNFKNGKMHGQGTLIFKNGNKYVGNFVDGHMCGKGTLTYTNGDKYTGDFKDDNQNGNGKIKFADGSIYYGSFKDGNIEGYGTFLLPNENIKYIGEVKNSEMDGEGTIYFIKDKRYINGIFKSGELIQTKYQGTYTDSRMPIFPPKNNVNKTKRK